MPTRGHQRSARPRKRGIIARLFRWIALLALAFVALSVGAVTALRWLAPPTSAFMVLDALGVIGSAEPVRYRWVPWAKISPHCPLAVMAAEDQRFPEHRGFDVDAIADAIESYREGGRLRGASTISQQIAKNLFLWPGRSLARKGVEAWFTALIELVWPKQRILEVYLNVAEFGPGTYGVGEASERFFHRPASDLSAGQCALLAAVLPNPRRFSVVAPTEYVVERQGWIRRQMRQLGGVGFLERI